MTIFVSVWLGIFSVADNFFVAVITSLIASALFWLFSEHIPKKYDEAKMRPIIDHDLLIIYKELTHLLSTPFIIVKHGRSYLFNDFGTIEKPEEIYTKFLATKCLTKEYQTIDEKANTLIPIGEELTEISLGIKDDIQKMYTFNYYMKADEILFCRRLIDLLSKYSFIESPFTDLGNMRYRVIDPTMRRYSDFFVDIQKVRTELMNMIIDHTGQEDGFDGLYKKICHLKVKNMIDNKQYKKAIKALKKCSVKDFEYHHLIYKAYYKTGEINHAYKIAEEYLSNTSERLISLRGTFIDSYNDNAIKALLIKMRSEDEYNQMVQCIAEEERCNNIFSEFARSNCEYYQTKLSN